MKKHIPSIITATLVSVLAVVGITYAATPASVSIGRFDTIVIGSTGTGGVTQFNGTIINVDQNTPVTFGDDVRVDGRIWRGANQGPALGDNQPFIINDDAQVAGSLTVGGTDIFAAIDAKGSKTAVDANTDAIANDLVTKASPSWNAQTGYVVVGRNEFQPQDPGAYDPAYIFELGLYESSVSDAQYTASVNLPHGATITEFRPYYRDTTSGGQMTFQFFKTPYTSYTPTDILSPSVLSPGDQSLTPGKVTTLSQTISETVDNSANEYHILAKFDDDGTAKATDLALYAVRLTYTFTQPY